MANLFVVLKMWSHEYIDTLLLKECKSNVLRLSCIKDFTKTRLRLRGGLFNQNRPWLPDDSTDNSVTLFLIKKDNDGHQQGRLSHDTKGETNLVNYCSRPEVRHRVLRNCILQNVLFLKVPMSSCAFLINCSPCLQITWR